MASTEHPDGEERVEVPPSVVATVPGGERRLVGVSMAAIGLGASIGFLWGYVATELRVDLGLSRAQVGALVSIYFGTTGLGSIAGGVLADRWGARSAVRANLATVAIAATVVVVAPHYLVLALASLLAGAAYSLGNAGTNIALAAAVPPRRRATALTVKTAGVPSMAVGLSIVAPWAAARFGWGAPFIVLAAVAAAILVVGSPALPTAGGRPTPATATSTRRGTMPRGFVLLPIGAFLLIAGTQPLFSWFVPYLQEEVGFEPGPAGIAASVAAAGGVVTMILVARRSDRRGADGRATTLAWCAALTAAAVGLLASAGAVGSAVAVIGAGIGTASQLAAVGILHAVVVDAAPAAVGRASGITMTGYYLGALVAPAGFGAIVDATGSYTVAWGVCAVLLIGATTIFGCARVVIRPV